MQQHFAKHGNVSGRRTSRIIRRALTAAAVIFVAAAPGRSRAAQSADLSAASAIVIDGWTGSVLYSKNPDVLRAPASTTKIMTALIVLKHHLPLNRVVTVDSLATSYGGSSAGLFVGEHINVWNLLHGLLLPSGNDAAVSLAEATAGTIPAFVRLMNRTAQQMHLWHTRFLSPTGLDVSGQDTTARDLARLARLAMLQSEFMRIVRTRYWTVRDVYGHIVHTWTNLNRLLWTLRGVDGIKTGTTPLAGACLVSSD